MVHNNRILQLLALTLAVMGASAAKAGLAWPWDGNKDDFNLFKDSQLINWAYNWESWVPEGKPDNFEYIAMQRTRDGIDQLQGNMQNNGAQILLGFNEPDIAGQANMGVDEAVQLWNQNIKPFGDAGVRLGSPATSNGEQGLPWLQDFMNKCGDCKVDFICVHWYGIDFGGFQSHIEAVKGAFPDKKIWVTEFALNLDIPADQQKAFFEQAIPYLDSQDCVERYAWFGAIRGDSGNSLIDSSGQLTGLGNEYVQGCGATEEADSSDSSDGSDYGYKDFLGLY